LKESAKKYPSVVHIQLVPQPLFDEIAKAFNTSSFLIIDGLDECSGFEGGLLDALCEIPRSTDIHAYIQPSKGSNYHYLVVLS
jgi:hypothetical protein